MRFSRAITVAFCAALFAQPAMAAAPADPPVVFAPHPPSDELAPRNDDERKASIIVLEHDIQIGAHISAWSGAGKTRTRHRVRYLVVDNAGVRALSQHRFFGDETNVTIEGLQGRTLTPDGGIHPVDPVQDIRTLDATADDEGRVTYRTINFPQVQPGAVLDLAWVVESKGDPGFESVMLEGDFPVRKLTVESQGTLIGPGKSILMMGAPQTYWVPFFLARIPDNVSARLSDRMDLTLSAHDLPSVRPEPLAPPLARTAAMLGIIPKNFGSGQWREHVHLFGDSPSLPERLGSEPVYTQATLRPEHALAEIDELGLQRVPLPARSARSLEFFQRNLKTLSRDYRKFTAKASRAETREELEQIAPSGLDTSERIDRLFAHVRTRVRLDPEAKSARNLDQLLARGVGDEDDLLFYMKYLATAAGLPNAMTVVFSRRGPPFLPLFEFWAPFPRSFFLEIADGGESVRYLQPGSYFANARSFSDAFLGGVMFREPATETADWSMDRLPIVTAVAERTAVVYRAAIPERSQRTSLDIAITYHDSAATHNRRTFLYPFKQLDRKRLDEYRQERTREIVSHWSGMTLAKDMQMPVADPMVDPQSPFTLSATIDWTPDIQSIDDRIMVPALPPSRAFANPFVESVRRQAIWLPGGNFEITAIWRVPAGYRVVDLESRSESGPYGLRYEITKQFDAGLSELTTRIEMYQPYILPAAAYAQTQAFFESLQRDSARPILLER